MQIHIPANMKSGFIAECSRILQVGCFPFLLKSGSIPTQISASAGRFGYSIGIFWDLTLKFFSFLWNSHFQTGSDGRSKEISGLEIFQQNSV